MDYSIRIASCQGAAPTAPARLRVGPGGCTIGRNPDNDLALADPERVVSGRHARLEVRDGALWITDLSTNGTFRNGAPDRLPPHQAVRLAPGDSLTVGPYELAVDTVEAAGLDLPGLPGGPGPDIMDLLGPGGGGESPRLPDAFADAVALDPLLGGPAAPADPALAATPRTPFEHVHIRAPELAPAAQPAAPGGPPAPAMPEDYDFLADAGLGGTDPFSDFDRAPAAAVDADFFSNPFADPPPTHPPPTHPPVEHPTESAPPAAVSDRGFAGTPPATAPVAVPFANPLEIPTATPIGTPIAAPAPSPTPVPAAAPLPRPGGSAEAPAPTAPGPAAAAAPAATPLAPAASPAAADTSLHAFLAGLGATDQAAVADPERLLHDSGRLLRVLIEGLIATMRVRAEFKSQMGLGVTILRAVENNPFKFSVDANEAMERLLFRPGGGYLPATDAARGAFEDLQAHEMAMLDSLRAAMRALLARFEPGVLEQRLGAASGLDKLLPMARRSRYWDVFTEIYEDVARDAADGFMELFSEAFTRAYEDQIRRLSQARRTAAGGGGR